MRSRCVRKVAKNRTVHKIAKEKGQKTSDIATKLIKAVALMVHIVGSMKLATKWVIKRDPFDFYLH